jgi:uncharacterized protein DUF1761
MTLDIAGINWLAVVVAAAVYFVLGAAWFAPGVFGKPWMDAIGFDASTPRPQMNPVTYAGPAVFYLIAAAVTAILAKATGTHTVSEGVILGLMVGIGYALTVTATDGVFDPNKPKPLNWFAISGAYHVVALVLVGMIIAAWQ